MDWQHFLLSTQGRISRRQYLLFSLLPLTVASFLVPGIAILIDGVSSASAGQVGWGISLALLLSIPMVWISVATTVKRWHDRGKSGLMYLVNLIPVVGALWTLYECCLLAGQEGENSYGLDPRMFNVSQMGHATQIEDVTNQVAFDDEDMMTVNEAGDIVDFDDGFDDGFDDDFGDSFDANLNTNLESNFDTSNAFGDVDTFENDLLDDFDTDLDADLNAKFGENFGDEFGTEVSDDFAEDLADFEEVSYVETGDAVLFEEEGDIDPLGDGLRGSKEESW